MDDWACLENRCGHQVTVGSNPTLSASDDCRAARGSFLLAADLSTRQIGQVDNGGQAIIIAAR